MCHMSHVSCHMSHVTFFFLQIGGASLWKVGYQWAWFSFLTNMINIVFSRTIYLCRVFNNLFWLVFIHVFSSHLMGKQEFRTALKPDMG